FHHAVHCRAWEIQADVSRLECNVVCHSHKYWEAGW
ncbi:MAG: hypothetical protein QOF46_1335, partial [Paraburkholderia sp.]|nr:hypothetical protein [Paraburkholderia sp.]